MLNLMITKVLTFTKKEDGATAIEYGLIAALVAVAIIGTLVALGGSLDGIFTRVSTELDAAATGS